MNQLFGKKIHISHPIPRMQCSPAFAQVQSPELVQATNAWMAAFFGHTEIVPDGVVYELNRQTLVMNRRTFIRLKESNEVSK